MTGFVSKTGSIGSVVSIQYRRYAVRCICVKR